MEGKGMPGVPLESGGFAWGLGSVGEVLPVGVPEVELLSGGVLFWEDKEVVESGVVGGTEYVRAYVRGTDRDGVWAIRGSGQIEEVGSCGEWGLPASVMFRALTSAEAPTELGEQMWYEEKLRSEVPLWADREVEIDHLLQEYPDQLDMAREELENGTLDRAGYGARVAELEAFKRRLEDELKTYDMERGEVAAQDPVLDRYARELAGDGITGHALAEHDWRPGRETPALGEGHESCTRTPEAAGCEPPAPGPPAVDHGDGFGVDM